MAESQAFDVLVVREIDRLSRSLAKQLIIEQELKKQGVEIEYVMGDYPVLPKVISCAIFVRQWPSMSVRKSTNG